MQKERNCMEALQLSREEPMAAWTRIVAMCLEGNGHLEVKFGLLTGFRGEGQKSRRPLRPGSVPVWMMVPLNYCKNWKGIGHERGEKRADS